jgi:carboxypeptidase T
VDRYCRNLVQIEAAELELANFSGIVTRTRLEDSAEGRRIHLLRIGQASGRHVKVLFVGGVHARELAPPSALLHLTHRLVSAYIAGSGISLGGFSVSAAQVERVVNRCDLYILPMANPDGRFHNLNVDANWRKSRAPRNCATDANSGTDINRNFPIAWNFRDYYADAVEGTVGSSDDPCEFEVYIGPAGSPQPETGNIKDLIDTLPLQFYVDVHAFGPKIFFPWGMERNGSNPGMRWNNATWDNLRDGPSLGGYSEFFPEWAQEHVPIAHRMVDAIAQANSEATPSYAVQQSALGGATTGASDDYAFSRTTLDPSRRTFAFTFESGSALEGEFQPAESQYVKIEREIMSGLLALLVHAVGPAPASSTSTSTSSGGSGSGGSGSGVRCCTFNSLYGGAEDPDLAYLRSFRTRVLMPSPAGRAVVAAYYRLSPLAVRALANRPATRRFLREHVVRRAVRRAQRRRP